MTSTSASRIASAIASQPLISCSVSTSWCSRSLIWTAISRHLRSPMSGWPMGSRFPSLPADRPQRARAVLLVLRIALARLARVDHDARAHRRPSRLFELEHLVAARALAGLDRSQRCAVVSVLRRLYGGLVLRLLLDERLHVFEPDPIGHDLRERAQAPIVGVVVLEHPESGEGGPAGNDDERVRPHRRIGLREDLVCGVRARDEQEAILSERLPDGLTAVPSPRLDALHEG